MSLAEMGRVARRRWYVLLPLLLLAAVLTAGVARSIPRQYQSTGMVSLLASQQSIKGTSTVPGTSNPFLSFDSSLNDTADFLVRRLGSTEAAQQLAGEGVGTYTAVLAASQGPFIDLTTNGASPQAARAAMTTLIGYTAAQLQSLQEQQGVPAQAMITSAVIVPGSPPAALDKRRVQDSLGAGAAGLALAVLATFAADSFAARRRSRRGRRAEVRAGVSGSGSGGSAGAEAIGTAEAAGASAAEPSAEPVRRRSADPAAVPRPGAHAAHTAAHAGGPAEERAPGQGPDAAAPRVLTGELISPLTDVRD